MEQTVLRLIPVAVLSVLIGSCISPARDSGEPEVELFAHPGSCRRCHDVRSDWVLLAPPPGLCSTAGCHPSVEKPFEKVHGPLALGACTTCHLQHSSAHPHLLVEAEGRLCTGCHQKLITCPSIANPPPAGSASPCTSCHGAHGGTGSHILKASVAVGPNRDQ